MPIVRRVSMEIVERDSDITSNSNITSLVILLGLNDRGDRLIRRAGV
jgi:hypothetical protein